jgi:hypothetical protein
MPFNHIFTKITPLVIGCFFLFFGTIYAQESVDNLDGDPPSSSVDAILIPKIVMKFEGTFSGKDGVFISGRQDISIGLYQNTDLLLNKIGTKIWEENFKDVYFTQGFVSVDLGLSTLFTADMFSLPNIKFVFSVAGTTGEISIPLRSVPYSILSEYADEAFSLDAEKIEGIIPSSKIQGNYPGITGIGSVTSTLNVESSLIVNKDTLYVDSFLERVGIGLTNPTEKLEINGRIKIREGGLIFPDGSIMTRAITRNIDNEISEKGSFSLIADSDLNGTGDLVFKTGEEIRMIIKNNGNVGINRDNPRATLDVAGPIRIGNSFLDGELGMIRYNGYYEGFTEDGWSRLDNDPLTLAGWTYSDDFSQVFLEKTDTKVGIGVEFPTVELEVSGNVSANMFFGSFVGDGKQLTDLDPDKLSGILPVSKGGTGRSFFEIGSLLLGNGDDGFHSMPPLSPLQIVVGNGAGHPSAGVLKAGRLTEIELFEDHIEIGMKDIIDVPLVFSGTTVDVKTKGSQDFVIMAGTGNVGISTTTPRQTLEVAGGIRIGDSDKEFEGTMRLHGDSMQIFLDGNWQRMGYESTFAGWTEDLKNASAFTAQGIERIGIGTNSPAVSLEVVGGIKFSDTTVSESGVMRFNIESNRFQGFNGTEWVNLDIQVDEGYVQRDEENGYMYFSDFEDSFGIGKIPDDGFKLDVEGAINATEYRQNGVLLPWTRDGNIAYVDSQKRVGIGVSDITARLDIRGGTSSTPSLVIRPGELLTTPFSGSIEFDGIEISYGDELNERKTLLNLDTEQLLSNKIISGNIFGNNTVSGIWNSTEGFQFGDSSSELSFETPEWRITEEGIASFNQLFLNPQSLSDEGAENLNQVEGAIRFAEETGYVEGYNGEEWIRLDYTEVDGYFARNDEGDVTLTTRSDRVGIGKIPSSDFKVDIEGSVNASGYYKGGVELPWVKNGDTVYLENENVAIGKSSPGDGYRLDVDGVVNASGFTINGGPVIPGGPAGGDLSGTYPNPELASSGVVAGTYGSAISLGKIDIDSKGRIVNVTTQNISGVSPAGPASGDLTGTYPSPVVAKLHGRMVSSEQPSHKQSLAWSDTNSQWEPTTITAVGGAAGDLIGTYPNPQFIESGVSAGIYGTATQVPQFSVDLKGRITSVNLVPIVGVPPAGTAGGDLAGNYPNPEFAASGVVAGTYGSSSEIGQYTVDEKGRITNVNLVTVSGVVPAGPAGGDLAGTYPNPIFAPSGVTAGTYGSATKLGKFTVDSKGRLTGVETITIEGVSPGGAAGGDLMGTYPNPSLTATGVDGGEYGSATHSPVFTVDGKGRITQVQNETISGVVPAGPAGGDLSGTYPNPGVAKIRGRQVSSSQPIDGHSLVWSDSNESWSSTLVTAVGAASGDLSGTYPNPTLINSGVTSGTYGSSTSVGQFTVDSKGRLTGVTSVAISGVPPAGTASGDLSGNYPNPTVSKINGRSISSTAPTTGQSLAWSSGDNEWAPYTVTVEGLAGGDLSGVYPDPSLSMTGVTAGTYGSSDTLGQFTVDVKGRITSVTNVTISGVTPAGSAGGDLSGFFPNPEVSKIQGRSVSSTAPSTGQSLVWNEGASSWAPYTITAEGPAGGDLTGTYPNPELTSIPGLIAGNFGSSTKVPLLTIDGKGRVTSVSETTISGVEPAGSAGGDLSGSYPNPTLASSGVISGTYGSNNSVAQFLVDAKGRITSVNNVAIDPVEPTGPAGGDLFGTYPDPTLAATGVVGGTYGTSTSTPRLQIDNKGRIISASLITISGVTPAGPAGGDLEGTYPNPTVSKLLGRKLSETDPSNGQAIVWNSNLEEWEPVTITAEGAASGDLTGTFPNPTLVNTGVTSGNYGTQTTAPQIQVDSKGRLTSAGSVTISGVTPSGNASGDLSSTYPSPTVVKLRGRTISTDTPLEGEVLAWDNNVLEWVPKIITAAGPAGGVLTGTYPNPTLEDTDVTFGTYGNQTQSPLLIVDSNGRITSANNITISGVVPAGNAGGDLGSTYPNPTVVGIRGRSISATVPNDGESLIWDVSGSEWVPGEQTAEGPAGGDLKGSYPNPTFALTGVKTGTYGSNSILPQLTIDAKGRVTNVTTINITGVLPGGSAGGDLSGTYPNPTVSKILNNEIDASDTPLEGESLVWVAASNKWKYQKAETQGSAGGDLTGQYPNAELVATDVTAGVYGSATQNVIFTVDTKGRITTASNLIVSTSVPPIGAAGGDLNGTYPNPDLDNTGVTPFTYGETEKIPVITVDSKGRLTVATEIAVGNATPTGNAGGDFSGTYPNPILNPVGVTAGTYGSHNYSAIITVDLQGRVTNASSTLISDVTPAGPAGGDLAGTYPNPTLAASGVTAGTYGASNLTPVFTVDQGGRVTSVVNTFISGVIPTGNAGGDLAGTYPNPTVVGLRGRAVSTDAPVNGEFLEWDGTEWGSGPGGPGFWSYTDPVLTTDKKDVRIEGSNGLLVSGTYVAGYYGSNEPPETGAGSRFMFLPKAAAIRAGGVSGTHWDGFNIGSYSAAFGTDNIAAASYSSALSGAENTVDSGSVYSTIQGGRSNMISNADYSFIGGGYDNTLYGSHGFIGGGKENLLNAGGGSSSIGGGESNEIGDVSNGYRYSTIAGGYNNTIDAEYGTIPGGSDNSISVGADYSFASGKGAIAAHEGSFVWKDSTSGTFSSVQSNEFSVDVDGGFRVKTATGLSVYGAHTGTANLPYSGILPDGSVFFFLTGQSAIRAGTFSNTVFNSDLFNGNNSGNWRNRIGEYSAAFGKGTEAVGEGSFSAGESNLVEGNLAASVGGYQNSIDSDSSYSFTAAGYQNSIVNSEYSFVGGYKGSLINSDRTFLWSGDGNSNIVAEADSFNVFSSTIRLNANDIYSPTPQQTSDRRFKKNIRELDSMMDKILKVRPVSYNWDTTHPMMQNKDNRINLGVIAQDFEEIFPELVSTDSQGYKYVNYSGLAPVLVSVFKEQQLSIEKQDLLIETQLQQINEKIIQIQLLEKRLSDLEKRFGQ